MVNLSVKLKAVQIRDLFKLNKTQVKALLEVNSETNHDTLIKMTDFYQMLTSKVFI